VNDADQRREVHFSGRVQGVGFRFTTHAIAARHSVCGFAKNLPDGRVLLVVEGEAEALDRFIAEVVDEMGRCIAGKDVVARPATGEFSDFEIRR
jgi:acylphosphatase